MKVKATTSFAGEICMAAGETRDVPESVAAPLLKCGYLGAIEDTEREVRKALARMSKDMLTERATEMGLAVEEGWTKADLIDAILCAGGSAT